MVSSLHLEQHVGFLSVGFPKEGTFPQAHILVLIFIIVLVRQEAQQEGDLSLGFPKSGTFPQIHLFLIRSSIPGFLHLQQQETLSPGNANLGIEYPHIQMPNCVLAPFSRPWSLQYSGVAYLKPYVASDSQFSVLHIPIYF